MNDKANSTDTTPPALSPARTSAADDADVRVRPGRRTVEERQQAALDLFAGKATIDQIARPPGRARRDRGGVATGRARERHRGAAARQRQDARGARVRAQKQEVEQVVTKLSRHAFRLSRAAYYTEAERQRRAPAVEGEGVVRLPSRPRYTCAKVVLKRIREVLVLMAA